MNARLPQTTASAQVPAPSRRARWGLLALVYAVLVGYGSLYPFAGWRPPAAPFAFLEATARGNWGRVDMLINVLAYLPLGFLLARAWARRAPFAVAAILATLAGGALSFAMESVQQYLPSRVASLSDFLTNTAGTLVGALLAGFLAADSSIGEAISTWRSSRFRDGRLAHLGLIAIGLWALSQLAPFVPTVDLGELRHSLAPLWATLRDPTRFDFDQWSVYATNIAGLALLARTLGRPERSAMRLFFGFVGCVLVLKVPIETRALSLEAIAGAVTAAIVAPLMTGMRLKALARAGALFILGSFAIAEMARGTTRVMHPFTWVPFTAQMDHPLIGMLSILENLWTAAALAYLIRFASPVARRRVVGWIGGLALASIVFALEWHQQRIPGRVGDITTVVLMAGTWAVFWAVPLPAIVPPSLAPVPQRAAGRHAWLLAGALLLGAAAVEAVVLVAGHVPRQTRVDENKLPRLPAPNELPLVSFAHFRLEHPHLPSPSASDLAQLQAENPEYLRRVARRAAGGAGDFHSATLEAFVNPGSVDLALLARRLLALKVVWRGHNQVKPLAVAYDWLYSYWSPAQRAALREKLVDGCEYEITLIRKDRLSPYNVILYNAPLQALMACSIAFYRDDPRADAIMAFTYDLWKHRVLPVWRQVMGQNGGWQEGGEYVGIGIGQAAYELPAMWRRATREDLFASEPGIRGFLDFLVYRARPDGTDFRWGDGAWFNRIVPDRIPLALEYRDAAAYIPHPVSKETEPTSWPGVSLTDRMLYDPSAVTRSPLVKLFDGIEMLVARSDWTPDATYVTFKGWGNYWSHTHLDQGAFTIYKGGPLAIDSGLYGPYYGSDHHMNYTYQTITHNTITVTDPDDDVPDPQKHGKSRPIANDGGQRRIGSGWGVEAGPLDLAEWEAKRDIYHTASMGPVLDKDGLVVAAADITPAYTNRESGLGLFSARTRRVERFWRNFGYDRVDHAIVVFDQVIATKASFRKRWLLHSIDAPRLVPSGFVLSIPRQNRVGRAGGRLQGEVLLPKRALVETIGGPGFQFYVDDKNYDENGKLEAFIKKLKPYNDQSGAWRIEVSPRSDEKSDNFLVVLLPTPYGVRPTDRVQLLRSGNRVGCQIASAKRITRWWFETGRNAVEIEVAAGGTEHRDRVAGPMEPPPPAPRWLARLRAAW